MSKVLTLDTVLNEPRQIIIKTRGRKLPLLPAKPKEIVINLPNPSLRQAEKLRRQYYQLANAYVNKDPQAMADISLQIVIDALKPSFPKISRRWIYKNLDEVTFAQILDFILQPTREREEQYLKNVLALQGEQK